MFRIAGAREPSVSTRVSASAPLRAERSSIRIFPRFPRGARACSRAFGARRIGFRGDRTAGVSAAGAGSSLVNSTDSGWGTCAPWAVSFHVTRSLACGLTFGLPGWRLTWPAARLWGLTCTRLLLAHGVCRARGVCRAPRAARKRPGFSRRARPRRRTAPRRGPRGRWDWVGADRGARSARDVNALRKRLRIFPHNPIRARRVRSDFDMRAHGAGESVSRNFKYLSQFVAHSGRDVRARAPGFGPPHATRARARARHAKATNPCSLKPQIVCAGWRVAAARRCDARAQARPSQPQHIESTSNEYNMMSNVNPYFVKPQILLRL